MRLNNEIFSEELSFYKKYAYGLNTFKVGDIVVCRGILPEIMVIYAVTVEFMKPNQHVNEKKYIYYSNIGNYMYRDSNLRFAREWEIEYYHLNKNEFKECLYPIEKINLL